ncbi:MAG: DUF4118 domain-containing protein [Clostridia bacterium]|nr:DUF4118 domain-containing protein [Clostridia bacterium]
MSSLKVRNTISNILQTIIVYVLTTLMAYVLNIYHMQFDSLKMLFLFGVLIVILQTQSFVLSFLVTLLFAATDAWLFINPAQFNTRGFILSTVFFIIISVLVSVLAIRLQKQIERSRANEQVHKDLYKASEGLIKVQGRDNIVEFADRSLTKLADHEVLFDFDIDKNDPDEAKRWCYRNSASCGRGEVDFSDSPNLYIPIRSNRKTTGVLTVKDVDKKIDPTTMDCIMSFVSQVSIALGRNDLEERNKKESAIFAREKIKGTVMKGLSHDMHPRITEIRKLAEELHDFRKTLSEEDVSAKLSTIQKEADYLSDTIDNILEITSR